MSVDSIGTEQWGRVKERLHAEVGDDIFQSWFARMDFERATNSAGADGKGVEIHLTVPTRFLRSWVNDHYLDRIKACWVCEVSTVVGVHITERTAVLATKISPKVQETSVAPRAPVVSPVTQKLASTSIGDAHQALGGSPLDPRLNFDNFVVGRGNTLAHKAAEEVATARAGDHLLFNPLYLHAGVGLGKSHLLQAIVWHVQQVGGRQALYLTAEKLVYGFASAHRTQTMPSLREKLRAIDVLVVDDLQLLHGKSSQAEFCNILNHIVDSGRQVVVACDRPPGDLEDVDERTRTRLGSGLVVEIGVFGEELREEILKRHVAAYQTIHPSFSLTREMISYIAKTLTHNGRDLDGVVKNLFAHSKLTGKEIDMPLVEQAVRDYIRPQEPRRVKIEDIQRVVARQYNVSRADLLSSRRTANVVRPRQVAMYLAKTLTLRSLPEIGRRFGGRDHTTVLHAVRKIEGLVGNDTMLADEMESLKRQLAT